MIRPQVPPRPFFALALACGWLTVAVAAGAAAPAAVDPAECTVTPLTIDDLVDIAVVATPAAAAGATAGPGEPADDAAVTAVTAVVRQSVACTNANDFMANLALFTDRYLAERFGDGRQDDLGHLEAALTREANAAAPEDRLALVSVDDVMLAADGRISATVTTANATSVFLDRLWFAETAEGWKIDAVEPGTAQPAASPAATPAG